MSRRAKLKLTQVERIHRECMMFNAAGEVRYRYDRYNEAQDNGLSPCIQRRRHGEFLRACDILVEVSTSRLPDAFLRYWEGEKAVADRNKLLGAGADVVPFKRGGRPG